MTIDARLTGGQVLGPDGLARRDIAMHSGRIERDVDAPEIDLTGYWIMPAFVDLHGDGFERHLAPRRGAMKDLGQGLLSADAELAANGIALAMLAQFYSWEGGMRGPDFARRFLRAHSETPLLTDTRVQLRFETHLLDAYDAVADLVAEYEIPYLVFNDHLPHDALAKGKRPPRLTGQALKSGRSPEAHLALLQKLHAQSAEVAAALPAFAQMLSGRGVLLGSHDDPTAVTRNAWRAIGATISEFPETTEAAQAARDDECPIILGAPNVVRGGSHSGKVSAAELVGQGLCDALASDYHYPAMKQAAFRLADDGVVPLQDAWALVSSGPARILGLHDRGDLAEGQRADLLVIDPDTRRIEATFCGGRVTHLAGAAAQRFLGQRS
jgi:alpha-D-ribose 1-methylphosphonate 5-triphosphate diphosphatase